MTDAPDIILKGGTVITPKQAKEALDEAMRIIEAVGSMGIYEKTSVAQKWIKTYYPNWAD